MDGMQIHGTSLYSWVERYTLRVRCLSQERKNLLRALLGPFDPQFSSLTIGPNVFQSMKLHHIIKEFNKMLKLP